jgi:hypothetical protein
MQQMGQMPMMQSGPVAMMPQMGMMPGGQRMPTGMMIAPGMAPGMTPDMMPVAGATGGPRPTTLSGASAEQSGRRRPINVLIGFVGAMVIGALIVVGARVTGKGTAAATNVRPTAGNMVSIVIKTDPPDAEVYRSDDDTETGKTPYSFQVKKGSKPIDIKVRLSGYREESRTITAAADQAVDLSLVKEDKPAATDTPPAATSETTSKPRRGRDKVAKDSETPVAKEPKEAKPPKEPKDTEAKAVKAPKDTPPKDATDKAEKPKKKKKDSGDGLMRPIF